MNPLVQRVANPHNIAICEWPFVWFVPSDSKPGRWRRVDLKTRKCDCPAGCAKKHCHHLTWVDAYWARLNLAILSRMAESDAGWSVLREIQAWAVQTENAIELADT